MDFTNILLRWYEKNGRSLPWRGSGDPYVIWISEIILQQTRIDQGMPYFKRFLEQFPDVHALARADEDTVLRAWQGLGYYSRARNLHHTAREISLARGGRFPKSSKEWQALKGVGHYTAAAIASFVYNEAVPALDGNGYRLLARFYGLSHNIDTSAGKKAFFQLAEEILPRQRPADFNQALMDFGSTVCKPVKPLCADCVFKAGCVAFVEKKVAGLPVRKPRRQLKDRFFNYFLIETNVNEAGPVFFVQKRNNQDIWKNMYEFPLLETNTEVPEPEIFASVWWQAHFAGKTALHVNGKAARHSHLLTHQRIHARLFRLRIAPGDAHVLKQHYQLVNRSDFEGYAKPRLIEILLEKINA